MAKLYHAPVTRHGSYGPLGAKGPLQAGNAGAARVSAALYRVTPPRKRRFCYNPDGEAKGASPRGGLVGCNKRCYGAATRRPRCEYTVERTDYGQSSENDPVLRRAAGVDHPSCAAEK